MARFFNDRDLFDLPFAYDEMDYGDYEDEYAEQGEFNRNRQNPFFYPTPPPDVYGPYTGFGPRGYKRPDDRIREDVMDRLWVDGQIDASDIDVSVNNGVITLQGTVESRRMKRMAEDTAWSVPGVDDVQNQLRLKQQGQPIATSHR